MGRSPAYIVGFAVVVCLVCSVFVASSAVLLKDRQEANKVLDRQKKVLACVGLIRADKKPIPDAITELFKQNVQAVVVDLATGKIVEGVDTATFDQKKMRDDPTTSKSAGTNPAGIKRVPNQVLVYKIMKRGQVDAWVFPIEGKGLWSTLYGYLAVDKDLQTVRGITYHEHGETPGLGGEVDNPRWQGLWPGRKVFKDGKPALSVNKGPAGPVAEDPYHVDGLSGATLTSRGVTFMLDFWFGDAGFGPFIAQLRGGA